MHDASKSVLTIGSPQIAVAQWFVCDKRRSGLMHVMHPMHRTSGLIAEARRLALRLIETPQPTGGIRQVMKAQAICTGQLCIKHLYTRLVSLPLELAGS